MQVPIAEFKKVSLEQFTKAMCDAYSTEIGVYGVEGVSEDDKFEWINELYRDICLPKRATIGSAGHDFYAPYDIYLPYNTPVLIPTGIRAEIDSGWWLCVAPRSGLGFKHKVRLNNTIGVIDSDYYYADNEGHIFIKAVNEGSVSPVVIKKGDGFAQGIFIPYGVAVDNGEDKIIKERTGGFGSTSD